MRLRYLILPALLAAAAIFSLAKSQPQTTGAQFITALERSHPRLREAILLIDYTPEETSVENAARQITERGDGAADGYGIALPPDHHWIKTADATFSWSPPPSPHALQQSLHDAAPQLTLALAHSPFDNAATDAAIQTALAALAASPDEQLFLAWANADHGVLAEANTLPTAARTSLLLLTPTNPGPILTFPIADRHLYLLPDPSTREVAWCRLECFTAEGRLEWIAILHVTHFPTAEHVRTLAAMFAEQTKTIK